VKSAISSSILVSSSPVVVLFGPFVFYQRDNGRPLFLNNLPSAFSVLDDFSNSQAALVTAVTYFFWLLVLQVAVSSRPFLADRKVMRAPVSLVPPRQRRRSFCGLAGDQFVSLLDLSDGLAGLWDQLALA